MKRRIGKILVSLILVLSFGLTGIACSTPASSESSNPQTPQTPQTPEGPFKEAALANIKNVILMIGDGMGPNHVKAGEIYKGEQLAIHSMPFSTYSLTRSASNEVTDSAAGATALATGVRTNNGYIGVDTEKNELTTIMDIALQEGKRTGIVTTDVISGATPMAFAAHCEDRKNAAELLSSARQSGVNLFVSTNSDDTSNDATSDFVSSGYKNVPNVAEISNATSDYVIGSYDIKASATSQSAEFNSVALDRVVSESIEYLSKDTDGFVLMAEGARIDKQAEKNNFQGMIEEMIAFDNAVQAALNFAKGRNDTIVIVTADHETGGLILADDITKENMNTKHSWTTTVHTATNVYCNVYAQDLDFLRYSSEDKATEIKNVDIFTMMKTFVLGRQDASITMKQNTSLAGTIALDQEECFYGQTVKITVKTNKNYRLSSFKINEKESVKQFNSDGTLEYVIDSSEVVFKILFVIDEEN